MQQTLSRKLSITIAMAAALMTAACGSDSGTVGPESPVTQQSTSGSGGTDTAHVTPTSSGPVVRVIVGPKDVTLQLGFSFVPSAVGFDAAGVRVANTTATWRSSDPSIVVTSDTGTVFAKAIGTAKVYGTIAGHVDSTTVTVVARSQEPQPVPPVASFDLTVTVRGALVGADTSRTEAVAGATVKISRTGGTTGDTLAVPVAAGTGVSDANGLVSFKGLTGGSYAVEIAPPVGSSYTPITTGFPPPRTTNVGLWVALRRQ